jgi:hypothetical protein
MLVIITLNQNPKTYESIPSSKIALFLEGDGKFTPFRSHVADGDDMRFNFLLMAIFYLFISKIANPLGPLQLPSN